MFDRVRVDYVDKPDDHKLIESALDGMLRELDPHSGYVDQASLDEMQRQSRGEFVGVGLEIAMEDGLLEVVTPIENSPAAKAGISANDVITKIDNKPVRDMTLDQAVEKLRGPKNTAVRLTISRKGRNRPIEITIIRKVINVKSVQSHTEDYDVGYIRITDFDRADNGRVEDGNQGPHSQRRCRQNQRLRNRFAQQSWWLVRSSSFGSRILLG